MKIFLLQLLLIASLQGISQNFNSSTPGTGYSFTVPALTTYTLDILAYGAGGNGNYGIAGKGGPGGGGGGAAAVIGAIVEGGCSGHTFTITVGGHPTTFGTLPTAGISSVVDDQGRTIVLAFPGNSAMTAGGGGGGGGGYVVAPNATDSANTFYGGTPYIAHGGNGGAGAAATLNFSGGGGGGAASPAYFGSNGIVAHQHASALGGSGGVALLTYPAGGNGGAGAGTGSGLASVYDGVNGTSPGGGGGGAGSAGSNTPIGTPGYGADGQVIIYITNTATGTCTTVPIKLISFNATANKGSNTLNWQTACGSGNGVYEIQSSENGINFTTIGTKVAIANNCNLQNSFIDNKNFGNSIYYRLKLVENDGNISYSNIISIRNNWINTNSLVSINPNPVYSDINLTINSTNNNQVNLGIYSSNGKLVKQISLNVKAGFNVVKLNAGNLSKGIYLIKGFDIDGEEYGNIKFIQY